MFDSVYKLILTLPYSEQNWWQCPAQCARCAPRLPCAQFPRSARARPQLWLTGVRLFSPGSGAQLSQDALSPENRFSSSWKCINCYLYLKYRGSHTQKAVITTCLSIVSGQCITVYWCTVGAAWLLSSAPRALFGEMRSLTPPPVSWSGYLWSKHNMSRVTRRDVMKLVLDG